MNDVRLRRLRPLLFVALLAVAAPSALAQQVHVVRAGDTLFGIAQTYGTTVPDLMQANGLSTNTIEVGVQLRIPGRGGGSAAPAPSVSGPPPDRPSEPARRDAAGNLVHRVQLGETLFRLARWYDTTVEDLIAWNTLTSTLLEVDQRVIVRPSPTAAPPTAEAAPSEPDPVAVADPPASSPAGTPPAATPSVPEPDQSAPVEVAPPPARSLPAAEPVRINTASPTFEIRNTTVPADEVHLVRRGETLYAVAARYQIGTQALVDVNPGLSTEPLVTGQMLHLPDTVGTMDYNRTVQAELPPPGEVGAVLVYPDGLAGRAMASDVAYDPEDLVASHRTLPFGSIVLVTNPTTQRSVFVRIADRGPISEQFMMELSRRAAEALGLDPNQTARVEIRPVR